jgi:Fe-S cluster biogenesis protein NfuA
MAQAKKQTLEDKISEVLEQSVRPFLAMHGGDVELESVKGGIVKLKLRGACQGCSMAAITFQMGVEQMLIEKFPDEIKGLEYD